MVIVQLPSAIIGIGELFELHSRNFSGLVELAPSDLIFMGTPEGVAAVARSDVLEASIEGVGKLRVTIA